MPEIHSETHPEKEKQSPALSKAPLTPVAEEKPPRSQLPGLLANTESPLFQKVVPPFADPVARLKWLWHKDMASRVFLVLIAALLVVSLLFAFSASALMSQAFPRPVQHFDMKPNDEPKVNGTVDLHPTFPVNYDHNRTGTSSLPPKSGTVATTSGKSQGDLQITGIPGDVSDGDTVHVTVSGQPGTTVKLVIQYDTDPYYAESSSRTIDSDGTVRLTWKVDLSMHGKDQAQAQVTAVSDSGQSGTVSVPISS